MSRTDIRRPGGGIAVSLLCLLLATWLPALEEAPPAIRADYAKALEQADVAANPDRHRLLSEWCRKQRWTAGAEYHAAAFNRFDLDRQVTALGPQAKLADLRRLLALAQRLKLDDRAKDLRDRVLAQEISERQAKLKPDDVAGRRTVLEWAIKEGAAPAVLVGVAESILALAPTDERANRILGRIKDAAGAWVDPWRLLVERGGLKDVAVRVEVHRLVAEAGGQPKAAFPADPFAGYEKIPAPLLGGKVQIWQGPIQGRGDGKGLLYAWAPSKYDARKSWPLILYLHGGGDGGVERAKLSAGNNLGAWAMAPPAADFVLVAPVVRNHVMSSWNLRENQLDAIDALIDACQRFNIDRTRIYLAGYSMGGGGVGRLSWIAPEIFAAFSPQAGGYTNRFPVPDLRGKDFFVVHGGKDTSCPVKLAHEFMDKCRAAGAQVEYLEFPEAGHALGFDYLPRMFAFLLQRRNPITPDLGLFRRLVAEAE